MSGTIRVVLVDDDPLVRSGLKMILGGSPDVEVVAEAADGQQAQPIVEETRPDVVLMDIRMRRMDGLEATRRILEADRRLGRVTRVIVLTAFETDDMVIEALRMAANGFLLKDTPPEQLVSSIRSVMEGDPILSPRITAQLIARVSQGDQAKVDRARGLLATLTEREREVAVMLGPPCPTPRSPPSST